MKREPRIVVGPAVCKSCWEPVYWAEGIARSTRILRWRDPGTWRTHRCDKGFANGVM